MDSITTTAAGTKRSNYGSMKIFPPEGKGHRDTGIHVRTETKRSREGAQWTQGIQNQVVEDQACQTEIKKEVNATQAKAIPEIERRRCALQGTVRSSLKDRAIAPQGLLNAIHHADWTRFQRSQRARNAVGSGDPDLIVDQSWHT
jgi:hypothetical protein